MITRKELTMLDDFDDILAGLTVQLDYVGEVDFADPETRTEYLEMFLEFQSCLENGEYSYRKVIDVLNEIDIENKFAEPLSLVEPTVAQVQAKTSNDALYGEKNHEVPVTNKDAWERLKAKYVIETNGNFAINEDIEPSDEDTEYAYQIVTMMEVLIGMLNKICEITDELADELIDESDVHEKSMHKEEKLKNRIDIDSEDQRIIEEFSATVMALSTSLDYANSIDFADPRSKAPFMELYVQLHTCLKSPEFSYLNVVKVLEKIDTEHKFTGFLTAAPSSLAMVMDENSRLLSGMTGEGLNDREAFEFLGKKYFMDVDGELIPRPDAVANPEDTGYAAQVMYMVDTLGANVFGSLCGIGMKSMRDPKP